ncbi:MAG: GreA/GreB family elongation factor [Kiritimatiellae bacterium]|nr:GreA/GreB family elongation factor [Kiritimatiellia bacterium]
MKEIVIGHDDAARIQQAIVESRAKRPGMDRENLERLERELQRARIVADNELPDDVVALNTDFIVSDCESGEQERYRLVLPNQANVELHRISVLAPVGAALLGYRKGDRVDWPVPGGVRKLLIEQASRGAGHKRMEGA